jgi:hypothetical protein
LFEVTHKEKQYVVNLVRRTYGCRQWDMMGIPCAHAICTIWSDNDDPLDYVDDRYTVDMLKKAYNDIVYPMPGEDH